MFTNCAELRLEDKEESLAAYREYIELETKEKDPARIQANRNHFSGLCHMSSWLFGHPPPPTRTKVADLKIQFILYREHSLNQSCGSGSELDPYSGALWIRIHTC